MLEGKGVQKVRAELACEPICTLGEKTGIVKVVFSFRAIDPGGELVELSWTDAHPQENGKRLGGTARAVAEPDGVPLAFVAGLPISLFLEPSRINLELRTLDPLRSLGHGSGSPEADADDLSGTVRFKLRSWTDLT